MRQGNPRFSNQDGDRADTGEAGGNEMPCEQDFMIGSSRHPRRRLTERDFDHNRRVRTLFDRIAPGLPIDHDPPETRREAEPFAYSIERVLKRLKIEASPWLDDLAAAWPTLVPPDVARVARPGKVENGILYVYVETSIQLFEIRRAHLRKIELAVQAFPGGERIRQVRFMIHTAPLL